MNFNRYLKSEWIGGSHFQGISINPEELSATYEEGYVSQINLEKESGTSWEGNVALLEIWTWNQCKVLNGRNVNGNICIEIDFYEHRVDDPWEEKVH